jgi:hypothetical protein
MDIDKKKEAEKPSEHKPEWQKRRDEYQKKWRFVRKINEYAMELIRIDWQGDNAFHDGKRVDMAIPGPAIDLAKGIACWNTPVSILILGGKKCHVTIVSDLDWKIQKMLDLYNGRKGCSGPEWAMRRTYFGYNCICLKDGPDHIVDMGEAQAFGYYFWYLPNNFKWGEAGILAER